jgi:hypothetical protein
MIIPGEAQVGRATATMVWASMVLVLGDVVAYLLIIRGQGGTAPDLTSTVAFLAGYMVLMAVLLWLSLLDHPLLKSLRPALRACAAAGLLVLGVLSIVLVPLIVAGVLATIAAIRALAGPQPRRRVLSEIAAAVIGVMVLVGGFEATQRLIVCPSQGTMSGGGSGFLTGAYHYECVNGTLTVHSGECNSAANGVDANGNPLSTNC